MCLTHVLSMKYDTKRRLLKYPVSLSMQNKVVSVLLYICLHIVLNILMCLFSLIVLNFSMFTPVDLVYFFLNKRKYAANKFALC